MKERMKRLIKANIWVLACVILFIIITGILTHLNMGQCTTVKYFGLYCPGCGGTRALRSLLRLDFVSMLRYNPILPISIILYAYYNIRAFVEIKRNNEEYFKKEKYSLIIVVAIIALIYFIIRNVLLLNGIDLIGDIIK